MNRPSSSDVGLDVINHVYDMVRIDPEWTVWEERGFTWWGWHCAQRVWAEPPFEDRGYLLSKVHVQTDVFDGFVDEDELTLKLGAFGIFMTMSGFIRSQQVPSRIQLACSAYVHGGTLDWTKHMLAGVVPLQAAEGAIFANTVSDMLGLRPAASAHPLSGKRKKADEMLGIIEAFFIPLGRERSKYAGEDMNTLLAILDQPPCVLVTGDEIGVTAEYPFPHSTSMLRISSHDKNPRIGHGLLSLLMVPEGGMDAETARRAMDLNEKEVLSFTGIRSFGSWCPSETGLVHTAFYPNALFRPGSVQLLGMNDALRARWFTEEVLDYDLEDHFEEALRRKNASFGLGKTSSPKRKRKVTLEEVEKSIKLGLDII